METPSSARGSGSLSTVAVLTLGLRDWLSQCSPSVMGQAGRGGPPQGLGRASLLDKAPHPTTSGAGQSPGLPCGHRCPCLGNGHNRTARKIKPKGCYIQYFIFGEHGKYSERWTFVKRKEEKHTYYYSLFLLGENAGLLCVGKLRSTEDPRPH